MKKFVIALLTMLFFSGNSYASDEFFCLACPPSEIINAETIQNLEQQKILGSLVIDITYSPDASSIVYITPPSQIILELYPNTSNGLMTAELVDGDLVTTQRC